MVCPIAVVVGVAGKVRTAGTKGRMEDGEMNRTRTPDFRDYYTNKKARPFDRGSEAQLYEAWLD